ncbi:MAG: signal transduction histidine kinase [Sulfitobacter sp.]
MDQHWACHPVPETKIRARYARSGPLIRQAILQSDVGHVFDNSQLSTPPERMLSFQKGVLRFAAPMLPQWEQTLYAEDLIL